MTGHERSERVRSFERSCRERGLPVTIQRRSVLEVLLASGGHPTAEEVFTSVRSSVPDISLTTVYRILDLLVDMELIRKTCSPGSKSRYDAKLDRHHHLVCLSCDRMVDLEDEALNRIPLPNRRKTGFDLVDYSIHFRGVCSDCLQKRGGAD